MALYEVDHVASAFARMEESDPPFDVLHDHCGFTAFAFADRIDTPVIHTLHGPVHRGDVRLLRAPRAQGERCRAQPLPGRTGAGRARRGGGDRQPDRRRRLPVPRRSKDDYLLWIGRINDDKGPQRAIAAAREAGVPLVLAGPVQPGQEEFFAREVEPHLDGDADPLHRRGGRGEGRALRRRERAAHADPLAGAVRARDDGGDGVRHAGDRVPRGLGAGDRARRGDRLRGRGRARDGRRDRQAGEIDPARCREQRARSASTWRPWRRRTSARTSAWRARHAHPFVDARFIDRDSASAPRGCAEWPI